MPQRKNIHRVGKIMVQPVPDEAFKPVEPYAELPDQFTDAMQRVHEATEESLRRFEQNKSRPEGNTVIVIPPKSEEQLRHERAVEMGRRGGVARAKSLTPKRRKQIAEMGARARWRKS